MLDNCLLTVLELIWNQRLGHKKTKLNICHHTLMSSTQLQNRSFHVVERTRTSTKCQNMKKACKNAVFHCQICKFVGFLLPSSSWLLKLPIISSYPASPRRITVLVNFQAILLISSGEASSNRDIFFTDDAAKKIFPTSKISAQEIRHQFFLIWSNQKLIRVETCNDPLCVGKQASEYSIC